MVDARIFGPVRDGRAHRRGDEAHAVSKRTRQMRADASTSAISQRFADGGGALLIPALRTTTATCLRCRCCSTFGAGGHRDRRVGDAAVADHVGLCRVARRPQQADPPRLKPRDAPLLRIPRQQTWCWGAGRGWVAGCWARERRRRTQAVGAEMPPRHEGTRPLLNAGWDRGYPEAS